MEKLSCYERVFNHFDHNGNGKISPLDLQNCFAAASGEELSAADAETAVAAFCSGGDGLLALEDFVKFMEGGGGEEEKMKELNEAFKMYEAEGLGIITPASLRTMLGKLGQPKSLDDCTKMIAKFDVNGDGVLSFDEFRLMIVV